jgi:hypothetical protein
MTRLLLLLVALASSFPLRAQRVNCNLYQVGSPCRQACDLYESPPRQQSGQGTAASQAYFDQILALCPSFAPAWREKAVPYLKRGDFSTWKRLIDEAVRLQPAQYVGYRGWCRFQFLRDYAGARADLTRLMGLTNGQPGSSQDGELDLRLVLALCRRELGDRAGALALMNTYLPELEATQRVGLYDYLHRGVTRLQSGDYAGARADLLHELKQVSRLAETHYYLGQVYQQQHQPQLARQQWLRADSLFRLGYHRQDVYSESPDRVYLADIARALQLQHL